MEIYSISISIVSLIISIVAAFFQIIHNKKSLKPLGRIIIGDYEDDIFVKIVNSGTGPLIVKRLECKFKEEKSKDTLIEILKDILLNNETVATDFVENITNRVIAPDKEIILLDLCIFSKKLK